MSIRRNRAIADSLYREAEAQRSARREHLSNAMCIVRRRIGSPLGLSACFGAGALMGWRSGKTTDDAPARTGEDQSLLQRMLDGPVGQVALRLGAAAVIQSLFHPDSPMPGDAGPAEPADMTEAA
jgi:hypothetical protein